MNRKQVLKEMKKNKKRNSVEVEDNYVNSFIFALLSLIVIFVAGYLVIGIFVTKTISFKEKEETKEEITIDNDTILLGQLFEQKDSEYYVLVYDVTDEKNILTSWKNSYNGKENALKVYVVDSENKLNGKYLVEKDSNKNASSYEELKVKAPTLIKVSDKKITEYIEGEEAIKNVFKN